MKNYKSKSQILYLNLKINIKISWNKSIKYYNKILIYKNKLISKKRKLVNKHNNNHKNPRFNQT